MDSEKKPMSPERLDGYRRLLATCAVNDVRLPIFAWHEFRDLLAAHDYHEQRADVAEHERDDMRVDLEIQVELLDSARAQRDALRAKLAEHGFPDTDPDVRRYKDHLLGVQESTAEYEVKHCENELSAALGQQTHGGWETLLSAVSNLRAEIARLRARVRVEAEDVERAGVTRQHVEAWLVANGWTTTAHTDGRLTFTLVRPRSTHYVHTDGWQIPWIANDLADRLGRLGLDILDEMAAMEVPS